VNQEYVDIKNRIKKELEKITDWEEKLRVVVKLLKEGISKYHWVGIYLRDGEKLFLHNYIGLPTIHTEIPIEEGICGAAVREEGTIIVGDVLSDPRYIACSLATRSEIVVPIYDKNNKIIGEIDIDSDIPAAFTDEDKLLLEEISGMIMKD
jgi:GAF domain-containing protein